MATYRDFTFNNSIYGKTEEVIDDSAIALALKNIVLSKPGNFPFSPTLGLDIEKYEFEFADENTLNEIKTNIRDQIKKFFPTIGNVFLDVRLIDDPEKIGRKILGITIQSKENGSDIESSILLYKEMGNLEIYNEYK